MKKTRVRIDKAVLFAVVALLLVDANAQDVRGGADSMSSYGTKGSSGHVGGSPFEPDAASDIVFVADTGGDLDQITWRSDGALEFDIPITRVIGDKQKLLAGGVIAATAKLYMPAWDVDCFTTIAGISPERDVIYFNDHVLNENPNNSQDLQGANEIWRLNEYDIPIEWINFPEDPGNDETAQPVNNRISIMVDLENSNDVWLTEIDWAQLNIEIAPPVVLAHGIIGDAYPEAGKDAAWDEWVLEPSWPWKTNLYSLGILNYRADLHGDKGFESIATNSKRIAATIEMLKKRWGVEKFTIVAHSKGGLDARDYAEDHDDIERLYQIATPNAGSPVADKLVKAGFYGVTGQAALELTTTYMSWYNKNYSFNRNTDYKVMAGHCQKISWLFHPFWHKYSTYYGHSNSDANKYGDAIVPVWSAHTMVEPFSFSPFTTSGSKGKNDYGAVHFNIDGDSRVGELLLPFIIKPRITDRINKGGRQIPSRKTTKGETFWVVGDSLNKTSLLVEGETKRFPIIVGQSDGAYIALYHSQGSVEMALIDPDGQRWDASAPSEGIEHATNEETEGFKTECYSISNAVLGVWTAEVTGGAFSGTQTVVIVSAEMGSSIEFETSVESQSVVAGEYLTLFAKFSDSNYTNDLGVPNLDPRINALVQRPDGTTNNVVLYDDESGDGVYSASFNASEAGVYQISTTVVSSDSLFAERMTYMLATASASSTSLATSHTDQGIDADGNGLFDIFRVQLELNVDVATTYRILAQLSDSDGTVLDEVSAQVRLETGLQKVDLDFSGAAIYESGADGPYWVNYVSLAEEPDPGILLPLFEREEVYWTSAYTFGEFEHEPISLAVGGIEPVDSDSDGLYDLLRAEVNLNLDPGYEGNYEWSASLVSASGVKLGFTSGRGYLSGDTKGGTAQVVLDFAGDGIRTSGENGSYAVENFILWGEGRTVWFKEVYESPSYSASDFKGGGGDIIVDVTQDVTTTYGSWVLNPSTGAMVATVTIVNNGGNDGIPLEKVFWYAIEEDPDIRLATASGTTNGLAYFDVTDQVEAQLPGIGNEDLKLDVGEAVTFIVAIFTRDRSIPTGHVCAIWADPPVGAEPLYHALDVNGDNVIDDFEILDAVDSWNSGAMDDFGLMDVIELWKAGGYSLDDSSGTFVPAE